MDEYKRIEAVRWLLDETTASDWSMPEKISTPNPDDHGHVPVLRETTKLIEYILQLNKIVSITFENKLQPDSTVAGRRVDMSMPVQLSQGIVKTAEIIEEAEEELDQYKQKIDRLSKNASFDSTSMYKEISQKRLALTDKIFERTRLFLHAHLWLHWIIEGVDQAGQIRHLIQEHNRFESAGKDAYAFFASPPLAVSIMPCTAVFEEVGAKYINQFTGSCEDPDETSFSDIFELINSEYEKAGDFNTKQISEIIGEARTDIAHYMIARKDMIEIGTFDQYVSAILECVMLIRSIVLDIIFDVIARFPSNLLEMTAEQKD